MRRLRRIIGWLVAVAIVAVALLLLFALARGRPQDLPWTPLDLAQPIGMFTGRKLAGLTQDFPKCRALLDRAGVKYTVLATVSAGQCGYRDGVRLAPGGARRDRAGAAEPRDGVPGGGGLVGVGMGSRAARGAALFRAARRRDRSSRQL